MKTWVLTQTAPHRFVIGRKIRLFLVEKQCRMAKMKIVRVLLFLVLRLVNTSFNLPASIARTELS